MSCTEMFVVAKDGNVEHYRDFQNSHGGAMAVWCLLGEKYVPQQRPSWLPSTRKHHWSPFEENCLSQLFAKAKHEGVMEPWERAVMLSTADNVMVPIERLDEVATAFEKFYEHYKAARERERFVFSIGDQAAALREILAEGCWRSVCWNQTSVVGDSIWQGRYVKKDKEEGEHECSDCEEDVEYPPQIQPAMEAIQARVAKLTQLIAGPMTPHVADRAELLGLMFAKDEIDRCLRNSEEEDEEDEEDDMERIAYNIDTMTDHWVLFAEEASLSVVTCE